jgi:toxin HigB-1
LRVTLDVTRNAAQHGWVIQSFRCKHTEALFNGVKCDPRWKAIQNVAERKLAMLHAAKVVSDLRVPPKNQLEALKRDRVGQHSIRINDQYRICFVWTAAGPADVEIVDYH